MAGVAGGVDRVMSTRGFRKWLSLARLSLASLLIGGIAAGPACGEDPFQQERQRLVRQEIVDAGVRNARVIDAMLETKRHEFVPLSLRHQAYYDMALPIGGQQTISSPFIVAYMTEALDPQPDDVVLEIGTGSGYQAAVLSPLVREVYTIEIVPELGRKAAQTLERLQYENIHTRVGDGYQGWPEKAPFDKIIVTCSPEQVPDPLVQQLREGGRLVIPVGERYQQILYVFRKEDRKLHPIEQRPTLFVPMTGTAEEQRQVLPDPTRPSLVNGSFEDALPRTDATNTPATTDTATDGNEPAAGVDGTSPADEATRRDEALVGWYYQRQARRIEDSGAPHGNYYVRLQNETLGRATRILQGLGIDGRKVATLDVSAFVRYFDVIPGEDREMRPKILITFYDGNRKELGHHWLGPWTGSGEMWREVDGNMPVPPTAREAILRVDLLGATGTLDVDHLQLHAQPR